MVVPDPSLVFLVGVSHPGHVGLGDIEYWMVDGSGVVLPRAVPFHGTVLIRAR